MRKFERFSGRVAPLDRADVDTDQIIPKQFLRAVGRGDLAEALFFDWRRLGDGTPDPDFVLNQTRYAGAQVLLARENFGCGSSREHAVWALVDHGFRAIVATSFSDIFLANATRNGLLAARVGGEECDELFARAIRSADYLVTVDLASRTLAGSGGYACAFEIDEHSRRALLEGLDEIAETLEREAAIRAHEDSLEGTWRSAPKEAVKDGE